MCLMPAGVSSDMEAPVDLLAILAVVDRSALVLGILFQYLTYRRTLKPLAPPIAPVSALFLVASMHDDMPDLPGDHRRQ